MPLIRRAGRRAERTHVGNTYTFSLRTRLWEERFQGPNPPVTQHGYFVSRNLSMANTRVFEARFYYDHTHDLWTWLVQQGSTDIISGTAKRLGEAANDLLTRLNRGEADAVIKRRELGQMEW